MCTTCGCGEGNLYIEGDEHNPHSAFRSAPFAPAARPKIRRPIPPGKTVPPGHRPRTPRAS